MNGHDEETYERKDLPTAFISREEHERILNNVIDKAGNLFLTFLPIGEVKGNQIVKASEKFLKQLELLKKQ